MRPTLLYVSASLLLGCAPIDKQLRTERSYDSQWARAIEEQEQDTSLASRPPNAAPAPNAPVGADPAGALPPGYRWTQGSPSLLRWTPGTEHPDFAHVRAAVSEGRWVPEAGYLFLNPPALDVVWTPGQPHPVREHVEAAETEERWRTQPGYSFTDQAALIASWRPGLRHPDFAGLVAARDEGEWEPAPLAKPRETRATPEALAARSQGVAPPMELDAEARWKRALPSVASAVALQISIEETPIDGEAATLDGLRFAMQRRDRAVDDALQVVLPGESERDRNGIANYIGLGFETGFQGWGSLGLGTLDQLEAEMKRSYPTLSDPRSAARLLVDLRSLYFR